MSGRAAAAALAAVGLAAAAAGPSCGHPHSAFSALEAAAYVRTFEMDARQWKELAGGLERVVAFLTANRAMFDAGPSHLLTPEEEAIALDSWSAFLDCAYGIDQIRRYYQTDYEALELDGPDADRHVRSFVLSFAAELSVYASTYRLMALLDENPNAGKFLDEARPERHIAGGSATFAREHLAGSGDLRWVRWGRKYAADLTAEHGLAARAGAGGYAWLLGEVDRGVGIVAALAGDKGLAATKADFAAVGHGLKTLTFPLVAGVAELAGDTRTKRGGRYLISAAQLEALHAASTPGDVWLVRKNWYLSNMALPGFWPHALLYVGANEELARTFDADADTLAWLKRTTGKDVTFSAYMAATYPEAWGVRGKTAGEGALLVIEAISEGVSQNTFEHASGDYLVSLRPKLPLWVKAQAIARAFGYLGRPYDFDFDFATDTSLVCTELVWRSYRPVGDVPGLTLPTVKVAGRETLPANEIAKMYARERGTPGAQLELVMYLEGREKELDAVLRDEEAFLKTPERSKWDMDQP